MSDLFDDPDGDMVEDTYTAEDKIDIDESELTVLDARRRLEKMLEEKRLRDELDDFVDY